MQNVEPLPNVIFPPIDRDLSGLGSLQHWLLRRNLILRDDGKRTEGMTLIPWKLGRPLVWDAICVDILAPSHLPLTTKRAGDAAAKAENLKQSKYANLDKVYIFVSFGVETIGTWGPGSLALYKDLVKRLVEASGDQNAGYYFVQKISIAVQRGNVASILGKYCSLH